MKKSTDYGATRRFLFRKFRVRKEDSAFVYAIFESHEGIASVSTLDFKVGDLYRDLELRIPPDFLEEADSVLTTLGDLVYELKDEEQSVR